MLGDQWWGVVFWVKEMLFSRVLCREPWMRAPVCTLGNIFFVWAHSSLPDSGSESDGRIQPAVLLLPRRPPPALARAAAARRKPRPTHKCGFALDRGWKCADLPTLPVTTCCANAERENGTNTFFFIISIQAVFIFKTHHYCVFLY